MSPAVTVDRRLTVVASDRHYDLAVPEETRVSDVLSVLGIASSASPYGVATPAGRILGPHEVLDDVPTGGIVTVVRIPTHSLHRNVRNLDPSGVAAGTRDSTASGGRHTATPGVHDVDDSTRRRDRLVIEAPTQTQPRTRLRSAPVSAGPERPVPLRSLMLAAAAGLAAVATLTMVVGAGSATPGGLTTIGYAAASLLLALAAVGVVIVGRRPGLWLASLGAGPLLAVAAGLSWPFATGSDHRGVGLVTGCGLAVVVLAVGRSVASAERRGDVAVMGILSAVGVLAAAGTGERWPGWAGAALVVGLAPLVVHILPSLSLTVAPTQLLDTDRLATTVWSVRERRRGAVLKVRRPVVAEQFAIAREAVAAGTLGACAVALVGAWVLVLAPWPGTVPGWGAVALTITVALAFGYQSRAVRDRLPRWAMLAAAAGLMGAAAVALIHTGWPGTSVALIVGGALVGWAGVAASVLLVSGYRSTRMSRLADALETMTVALALPLGIVAADGIEALRRLTSG